MKIKWLGHSCFKFTSDEGVRVVTDPFDMSVGYDMPNEEADVVTSSHGHFDHSYKDAIKGSFEYINESGTYDTKGIHIKGTMTCHDKMKGIQRGKNIIFTYEIDGIRLCHMGDLGHLLNNKHIDQIGKVDILMLPVGGHFTIDGAEAAQIVEKLDPKLVIPMHFKTDAIDFPIAPVDDFLSKAGAGEKLGKQEIELTKDELEGYNKKIIVMEYK